MTEVPDELCQRVNGWLEKNGYPLEMRVARAFQKNDFQVIPSDRYLDEDTGKAREIDVVAFRTFVSRTVGFAVECKSHWLDDEGTNGSSKRKPWAILSSGHPIQDQIEVPRSLRSVASTMLRSLEVHEAFRAFWAPAMENSGHSMVECFSGRQRSDKAYTAAMSSLKAARSLVSRYDDDTSPRKGIIFIPMIV
ncbi:MAG: hypothetical protein AAGD06_32490, partial [Acidobacteriota bacterium]